MSRAHFLETVQAVAGAIGDKPLDDGLAAFLNATYPANGADIARLKSLCVEGERDGWLLARPHHERTRGEIGPIMPIAGAPRFDGCADGWYVYGPGSGRHPTVTGADAYGLYLLPEGAIGFTGR